MVRITEGGLISALDQDRKFKFSSYFLPSLSKMFQYCHASAILCNVGEVGLYIFDNGLHISALENAGMLNLSSVFSKFLLIKPTQGHVTMIKSQGFNQEI